MLDTRTLSLAAFAGIALAPFVLNAQTTPPQPAQPAPVAQPAPAAPPTRPPPPTRPADGPGAPKWTVVEGAGMNAPADAEGDFLIGPNYLPAKELEVVDGVPRGSLTQFTIESVNSKFYPGIARDAFGTVDPNNPKTLIVETRAKPWSRAITVYVPAQYKKGSNAPFIVTHDGPRLYENDPALGRALDNLIAQKRVPPMVAISIQNGGGDAQGSQRGLEYDTMSGKFAEFIQAEVLPAVEKHAGVKLTKDPEGRAVMGCSSGAAAALSMAWYHNDWYHRVISYSGTYVNQQWPFNPETPGGAWGFHETIIPDSPPKPIRIWMHVGDRDLYNPNIMRDNMHDWVEANHKMAAVLKAKGYHYQYVYALDSGHCDRKVREQTLPQALEWVWRGFKQH
jgi:iron(III)-enterobactin esterase